MSLVALQAVLTPVIVGLVQVAKRAGLADRWAPVAAILLGVLGTIAARGDGVATEPWSLSILAGIVAGLSAAGLYSGQRALRE